MSDEVVMRAGVGRGGHRAWVGMCVVLVCVGVLTIAGGLGAAPGYPVKVGSTGRHVVDQNGVPFLLIGDSPQGMIANLSLADAEVYFSSRQSYGYNAVQIHLLAGPTFNGRSDFSTQDGITPFTTDGDLSTPREAYFARVDDIVNLAAQHDMLVFLTAAETIDGLTLFKNNGVTKCRAFGQYLGNRYKNYKNIVWNYGNDFQTWRTSDIDVILAVADGINDTAPNHLNTAWLDYLLSASRDSAAFDSRIQLDFVYSYYSTYAKTLDEYSKSPAKPIHLGEANYEEESLRGYLTTPFILRKQNYWAMTSGASGVFSVNGYMWRFEPGWELRLDSTGTQQLAHFINLFSSISWWKLVPDSTHQVMTAGYGTYAALGGINTNDYASAAMTDDGTTMVAYIPTIRTITVDMSRLAGPAIARWYDPSNGASVAIPGSPLPNTGMLSFTPPGNNADGPGNEDWVLVLEVFPPSPPSNLHAGPFSDSEIDLTWAFASADADGFKVERRTGTGSFTEIAVIDAGQRSYSDTGLTQATTYFYQIRAFNGSGNSDYSNQDSSTTLAPAIDALPGSWDYGNVSIGNTKGKEFTIGNTGSSTVNVSATTLLGPDAGQFAIGAGGGAFALAPGESRTVGVTFAPTSIGVKSATFRLTSNDAQRSPSDIPITGNSPQSQLNQPDLTETSMSTPPSAAAPGASFQVTDTVKNQGGVLAGASKTRYYLALAPLRDAGNRLLTGIRSVASLAPNGTSTGTASVTIPANTPLGTYYVLACADDTTLVKESDEGNNCLAATTQVQVTRPDLVQTAVSNPPATTARGSKFAVTDSVKNQGAVASAGSVTRYYLSADPQKGSGDTLLAGNRVVPGLAPGASSSGAVIMVTVPSTTSLGLYYLLACADDTTLVTETGEGNNCLAATTQVQVTRPDLVQTAVSNPPATAARGGKFAVTDTVKNQGAVASAGSVTRYYLSADRQRGSGDILLGGNRVVPGLAPGASSSGAAIMVTVPSTIPLGLYYLLACADDTTLVTETDEGNNCLAATTEVQVTRPDLVQTAVSNPPATAARGSKFTVTDTVKNQGAVASASSITRYYLSADQQKGGGDTLLAGNRTVPGLAPGASSSGAAIMVTVPSSTPLGLYYLLACADDTALVSETDEGNNCRPAETQVQVTVTP